MSYVLKTDTGGDTSSDKALNQILCHHDYSYSRYQKVIHLDFIRVFHHFRNL